ncbi:MAG: hypothetical protein WBA68_07990 [Alteraurantiacibacter sp.]
MIRYLAPLALLAIPSPAAAQDDAPPELTLEQRMLARCGAAFALVAEGQANGNAEALAYSPMAKRGREFFVQAGARLMDEAGLTREELSAVLSAEAQALWDEDALDAVMPACLPLLPRE